LKNTRIAFVSDRDGNPDPHFYTGDGQGEIYVMNADGSNVTKLTNSGTANRGPSWSPDRKRIAFMSNRANTEMWDIYVMNADGSNVIKLTENHGDNFNPNWSPDGQKLVFSSNFGAVLNIFMMNADGSNIRKITEMNPPNSAFAPIFYNNGMDIICMSNCEGSMAVLKIDLATGNLTNLTQLNNKSSGWPNLSPDGHKIVYYSYTSDHIDLRHPRTDIFIMNLDNSESTRLTATSLDEVPKWNMYPDWSPDGTKIIFSSNRSQGIWQQYGIDAPITQLYIMDADGNNVFRIPYIWGNNWDASWSPK
jgi:TolB protein